VNTVIALAGAILMLDSAAGVPGIDGTIDAQESADRRAGAEHRRGLGTPPLDRLIAAGRIGCKQVCRADAKHALHHPETRRMKRLDCISSSF